MVRELAVRRRWPGAPAHGVDVRTFLREYWIVRGEYPEFDVTVSSAGRARSGASAALAVGETSEARVSERGGSHGCSPVGLVRGLRSHSRHAGGGPGGPPLRSRRLREGGGRLVGCVGLPRPRVRWRR